MRLCKYATGIFENPDKKQLLLNHEKENKLTEKLFPEVLSLDIRDIYVRLAVDESAHADRGALARIQLGYKAIALKPVAKILSMSLKIASVATQHNVPCFCADLTVNPILVDWN